MWDAVSWTVCPLACRIGQRKEIPELLPRTCLRQSGPVWPDTASYRADCGFLPHLAPKTATAGQHGRDVGSRFPSRGRGWNHIRKNARAQSVSACAIGAYKMYAEVSLHTQNRRTQYGYLCTITFFNVSTPNSSAHLLSLKSHRAYFSLRCPKSGKISPPV